MCEERNVNGIKNFKIRRRTRESDKMAVVFGTVVLCFAFLNCVLCSDVENDVLTLQDELDIKDVAASDRRRPVNEQEKDILLLDALGRRKGSYSHNSYSSSQEDDSIMDLLGKSEYFY